MVTKLEKSIPTLVSVSDKAALEEAISRRPSGSNECNLLVAYCPTLALRQKIIIGRLESSHKAILFTSSEASDDLVQLLFKINVPCKVVPFIGDIVSKGQEHVSCPLGWKFILYGLHCFPRFLQMLPTSVRQFKICISKFRLGILLFQNFHVSRPVRVVNHSASSVPLSKIRHLVAALLFTFPLSLNHQPEASVSTCPATLSRVCRWSVSGYTTWLLFVISCTIFIPLDDVVLLVPCLLGRQSM